MGNTLLSNYLFYEHSSKKYKRFKFKKKGRGKKKAKPINMTEGGKRQTK